MNVGTKNNPPIRVALKRSSGYQTPLRRFRHFLTTVSDRRPETGAPTVKYSVSGPWVQEFVLTQVTQSIWKEAHSDNGFVGDAVPDTLPYHQGTIYKVITGLL